VGRHKPNLKIELARKLGLALADAADAVGWRGTMRHLPSVGALPTPPATTPYLIVKQDDNGATFVITAAETPWIAAHATHTWVAAREIGAWTHPTADDIPTHHGEIDTSDLAPTLAGETAY